MKTTILSVKEKLDSCISQLSEVSWMFSQKPGVYFTRDRKLPFHKVISCLLLQPPFWLLATKKIFSAVLRMNSNSLKNDILLRNMIYGFRRMIYLLRKHDIISVPSYAAGIYHPPQVDIISKIYHPFRQERISLKNDKFLSKLVVFHGIYYAI